MLCFDSDARKNVSVARAMVRLGRWCCSKAAKTVKYLIVPLETNGTPVKGVDDYFSAGGTLDSLMAAATTREPQTEPADDTFSDSRMAETVADEVLADRFCWCKPLGWMGWNGKRWMAVSEEAVGEALRQFVLQQFTEAVRIGARAVKGWYAMLGVGRQRAVLSLTKGIVEVNAKDFDSDPNVLNTPAGVVHLPTGQVNPHDPDLLLTKITSGSYRPECAHQDWHQALSALREDARPWFQMRVGQAITGHPTSDGVIPIAQGSGENGKSAVMTDGILQALGDYAAPVSPKLVASKDEHSTERADLRGQRFLVAEELTENHALNLTAIKRITDVSRITARYVFQNNMTFSTSHSLFITTNYIPVVNETDHGTWRRLARLVFPFTFRKPGEPLHAETDRRGDPRLKARLRAGAGGVHDAIVTWAVEGARSWYERGGFLPLPPSVDADTRAWRREADRILGFWDEVLVADRESCVLATDLHEAFNGWLTGNGHHRWSKELFVPRFRSHDETVKHHVVTDRTRRLGNLSRPSGKWEQNQPDLNRTGFVGGLFP